MSTPLDTINRLNAQLNVNVQPKFAIFMTLGGQVIWMETRETMEEAIAIAAERREEIQPEEVIFVQPVFGFLQNS